MALIPLKPWFASYILRGPGVSSDSGYLLKPVSFLLDSNGCCFLDRWAAFLVLWFSVRSTVSCNMWCCCLQESMVVYWSRASLLDLWLFVGRILWLIVGSWFLRLPLLDVVFVSKMLWLSEVVSGSCQEVVMSEVVSGSCHEIVMSEVVSGFLPSSV